VAELAASALPFQSIVVAKSMEDVGVFPNVLERLSAKVSSDGREISAGEDFAFVRDETHACSSQAAFSDCIHGIRMTARVSARMAGMTSS
jgi:hypothetical protein